MQWFKCLMFSPDFSFQILITKVIFMLEQLGDKQVTVKESSLIVSEPLFTNPLNSFLCGSERGGVRKQKLPRNQSCQCLDLEDSRDPTPRVIHCCSPEYKQGADLRQSISDMNLPSCGMLSSQAKVPDAPLCCPSTNIFKMLPDPISLVEINTFD